MNINIIRVECNVRTATAKACTQYKNFRRVCRQDVRYWRGRRRSFTYRSSHEALRIKRYESSTRTDDCSIFEKKRSLLDCTYDINSDNVSVRCSC